MPGYCRSLGIKQGAINPLWTEEQKSKLRATLIEFGLDWDKLISRVGRSKQSIKQRVELSMKKGIFTTELTAKL